MCKNKQRGTKNEKATFYHSRYHEQTLMLPVTNLNAVRVLMPIAKQLKNYLTSQIE
jgi:hypothetical protein